FATSTTTPPHIRSFFTTPDTTDMHTLSLHDALPISSGARGRPSAGSRVARPEGGSPAWKETIRRPLAASRRHAQRYRRKSPGERDRKSTRLNSSHVKISYAVFCLKKKKTTRKTHEKA